MEEWRPPQLEEFDKAWVPELSASMVVRGLAALPSAPPPAPPSKAPPPGISDQDVVDMVGLGIIASWRERVRRDPLGTERGSRVCLSDLTKEFVAWNSCQLMGCSEMVYREACAALSMGDPDEAAAVKKRSSFLIKYRQRAHCWDQYLASKKAVRDFISEAWQEDEENAPDMDESEAEEPVNAAFPSPMDFSVATARRGEWACCFSAMTCIVRALDETLWDSIDSPILRMWRDARSAADLANVYAEVKWGVPKSRQRNPAVWLTQLLTCAMGSERDVVMDALVENTNAVMSRVKCMEYSHVGMLKLDFNLLRYLVGAPLFKLSLNGFYSVHGTRVRLLTATVLLNNLVMFEYLLSCPEVDINARTIVNDGGMSEFPALLAIPCMLASKPQAEVMLNLLLQREDLAIGAKDCEGQTVLHVLVERLLLLPRVQLAARWHTFLRAILNVKQAGAPLLARNRRGHHTARDILLRSDKWTDLKDLRGRMATTAADELELALSLD